MKKTSVLLAFVLILPLFLIFNGCSCSSKNKDISIYEIQCELSGNTLTGKQKVTFYNDTDNAFSELKFNLFGNAFREDANFKPIRSNIYYKAYPNGVNYGDMKINSVKDETGDLNFTIGGEDKNVLIVNLSQEVYPEDCVEVEIDFVLTLADVISRTGINSKTINLGNFYPILCGIQNGEFYECVYYQTGDPFFSDCANYNVKITVPDDMILATSGKLTKKSTQNGKTTSEFTLKNARSFAIVGSKDFKILRSKVGETEVLYYYYDDEFCKQNLHTIEQSLTYFNQTFGTYPYETFSVVKTKFIEGGMEYPGLVYIQDELEENQYKEVIVHETAHQWWQSVVGNNEIEQSFLDEGLAEYSVVLFYENHLEYGYLRKDLISSAEKTYKAFCTVYDKIFKNVNTKMQRSLNEFSSDYEYVNIAYIKPCIMFDYFRTTVGDKKFFNGLKRYFDEFKYKNATIDDLISCFIKEGAHAEGFFESFIEGKVVI